MRGSKMSLGGEEILARHGLVFAVFWAMRFESCTNKDFESQASEALKDWLGVVREMNHLEAGVESNYSKEHKAQILLNRILKGKSFTDGAYNEMASQETDSEIIQIS